MFQRIQTCHKLTTILPSSKQLILDSNSRFRSTGNGVFLLYQVTLSKTVPISKTNKAELALK